MRINASAVFDIHKNHKIITNPC